MKKMNAIRRNQILSSIDCYPNIKKLFGEGFLNNAIQSFSLINGKWSPENYAISNYLMSGRNFLKEEDFIIFMSALEKMILFYVANYPTYITSSDLMKRLKSKKMSDFQGKWTELIFGYYLHSKGIKIEEMSPKEETSDGEKEICDIRTDFGEIEVSIILSDKRVSFSDGEVFFGDTNISYIDRELVNKKISRKKTKKILAIDCSLLDEIRLQFLNSYLGFDINFDVFKETSKKIILFIRDPLTEQVACHKIVNLMV